MKTDHPNLLVTSPVPGHFIIEGLAPGTTQTEEGRHVHPTAVHIPPSVPSDVLLSIVEARGDAALQKLVEIEPAAVVTENNPLALILAALPADGSAMRIKELAEKTGLEVDAIKRLDGLQFEIGNAGWVKLKREGGEA